MIHGTTVSMYISSMKKNCLLFTDNLCGAVFSYWRKFTLKTCPYTALVKIVKKAIFNELHVWFSLRHIIL
jgi:hypothetical protein